ncbi:MAG: P-loop NTPase fold protein [Roseiflexaceae bacterium]
MSALSTPPAAEETVRSFLDYLSSIEERVEWFPGSLLHEPDPTTLREFLDFFIQTAKDLTNYRDGRASPYYKLLNATESTHSAGGKLIDAIYDSASQIEQYAKNEARFSATTASQWLNQVSIALKNLRESISNIVPIESTHVARSTPPKAGRANGTKTAPNGANSSPAASDSTPQEQATAQTPPPSPTSTDSSSTAQVINATLEPDTLQSTGSVTPSADVSSVPAPATTSMSSLPRRLREDAVDRGAVSDQSLRRKADDQLGYIVYIEALQAFICSQDTTTPLTIGIDGAWGSGKTSLMRMVQNELDEPLSFSRRLAEAWVRLIWLGKLCLALPFWLLGVALVRFNGGTQDHPRWPNIRAGCSFDPAVHDRAALGDWPRSARFWATIAAWRQPQSPPFHPTIWFNAWKFDQEEQLWAALAVEALRQIKQRYGPIGRFFFWMRLTWRRFTPLVALFAILQRIAIPLLLGVLAVLFDVYLKQLPSQTAGSSPRTQQWLLDTLLPLGQPLLLGGALITGIIQIAKIVKDPFQLSVNDLLRKPDYEAKIGFLGAFEADFAHIVAVATRRHLGWKPQKLVIFIDDLDRCEPPKSVDVIEAINLLLDSERCIFVIGMDAAAVVASIDTKYEKLFEKMRKETTGIASPGRFFLDKIIQVPFQMPSATEKHVDRLVASLIESRARPLVQPPSRKEPGTPEVMAVSEGRRAVRTEPPHDHAPGGPDIASYAREDVQDAIRLGARLLAENPRQIKRFVNVFRLHVYITSKLGLFEEQTIAEHRYGLTLNRLAVWIAWSIRWADLAKHLLYEAQLQRSWLRDFLASLAECLCADGSWLTPSEGQEHQLRFAKSLPEAGKDHTAPENLYQAIVAWVVADRSHSATHAPWLLLPWEWWLMKRDFLEGVKSMESFWRRPDGVSVDWFKTTLLMTRVDFEVLARVKQAGRPSTSPNSGVVVAPESEDNPLSAEEASSSTS